MEAEGSPEDRLEAALERIAKIVEVRSTEHPVQALPDQAAADFADRLDRIIDTLRDALGK